MEPVVGVDVAKDSSVALLLPKSLREQHPFQLEGYPTYPQIFRTHLFHTQSLLLFQQARFVSKTPGITTLHWFLIWMDVDTPTIW